MVPAFPIVALLEPGYEIDGVEVSPSEEKPSSPFERRAMKFEIIGALDALLSPATKDRFTLSVVGDGVGSGGGTI
jgi:hypothetical protein